MSSFLSSDFVTSDLARWRNAEPSGLRGEEEEEGRELRDRRHRRRDRRHHRRHSSFRSQDSQSAATCGPTRKVLANWDDRRAPRSSTKPVTSVAESLPSAAYPLARVTVSHVASRRPGRFVHLPSTHLPPP